MSALINYTKGHGTKNDFVLIEDLNDTLKFTDKQITQICDRNNGIGADGILRIV